LYRASGGDSCGVNSDNSSDSDPFDLSTNQRIGIYGGIVFGSVSLVMTRSVLSFLICIPQQNAFVYYGGINW